MELIQLDIFNLEYTKDKALTKSISIVDELFCIPKGTKVYLSSNNKVVYEVISDNGKEAVVINEHNKSNDCLHERIVPSTQIKAIIGENGTVTPLPTVRRSKDLDLNFFRERPVEFTKDILLDREKQLDYLTYLFLVTPSLSVNTSVSYILGHLLAMRSNSSVEYRIFSASSYIKESQNLIDYISTFHTGKIVVRYKHDKEGSEENYHNYDVKEIVEHFYLMKKRIKELTIEALNPFELSLLYLLKGYVLVYSVETDEWHIQHPDSNKSMPILKGREELNFVDKVIERYENKFVKCPFKLSKMVNLELELFETTVSNGREMSGFTLPEGAIVQLNVSNGFNRYIVISDTGSTIKLCNKDDSENVITVSSKSVVRIYPYADKEYISFSLPRYNRPKTLTVDTLTERDQNYYHKLTSNEIYDLVVIKTLEHSGEEAGPRIVRAMLEGDENLANEIIKKSQGGLYSSSFSYKSDGHLKKIRFGYDEKPLDVTMTINQIVQHYKKMVRKIQLAPLSNLSVYELELAYYLLGFKLKYNHITDEFTLSKGIQSIDVLEGREYLNNISRVLSDFKKI